MSNISIPGFSSNVDNQVERIMEVERTPLVKLEERVEEYNEEKSTWQRITRLLTVLREQSRLLFSFENPFAEKIIDLSNENILTAIADRTAVSEVNKVVTQQLANRDVFLSDVLDIDYHVAAGLYTFTVGEREVNIEYAGGDINNFIQILNRKGHDVISAQLIKKNSNDMIFILSSHKTGAEYPLQLKNAAKDFGLDISLIQNVQNKRIAVAISDETVLNKSQDGRAMSIEEDSLILNPKGNALIIIPDNIEVNETSQLILNIQYDEHSAQKEDKEATSEDSTEQANDVQSLPTVEGASITYRNIEIFNEASTYGDRYVPKEQSSVSNAPTENTVQKSETEKPQNIVSIMIDGQNIALTPILLGKETYSFVLNHEDITDLNGVRIHNPFSDKTLYVNDIEIINPVDSQAPAYEPVLAASRAQNAKIMFNGIALSRETNVIDDVIPGVTLTLKKESTEPVELDVGPNIELIKNSIIEFIYYYNQVMQELNIVSVSSFNQNKENIINEITFESAEERDAARERLGQLQSDSNIQSLRNAMRIVMGEQYPIPSLADFELLNTIGLSINATQGTQDNITTLKNTQRGYMQINETVLDNTLSENLETVKELFGSDNNGDLIIDNGVAFQVDTQLKGYLQTGGIISRRIASLDITLKNSNEQISTYEEKLARREQELRADFAEVEQASRQLQESQKQFQGLTDSLFKR